MYNISNQLHGRDLYTSEYLPPMESNQPVKVMNYEELKDGFDDVDSKPKFECDNNHSVADVIDGMLLLPEPRPTLPEQYSLFSTLSDLTETFENMTSGVISVHSTEYEDEQDDDAVFISSEEDYEEDYEEENQEENQEEKEKNLGEKSDTENQPADSENGMSRETDKVTRKRLRYPDRWQRNVKKKATNLGQEYVSSTSKKLVEARSMKSTCGPGCRFKCESKISEQTRSFFFSEYWSIENQSRKYDFISRYVTENPTNKVKTNELSKRNYSRTYTIAYKDQKIQVCQTMFCNTLSIDKQVVNTVFKKIRTGDSVMIDKRGTSKYRPRAVDKTVTDDVKLHISMFPKVESHYCRKNSNREYLEENLSYAVMHRLYQEWAKENDKKVATLSHYKNTFDTQFNLGFFKPKKDRCDTCECYENAKGEEQTELSEKYQTHIANKKIARKLKDEDKVTAKTNQKNTTMACFDFQKILSTPQTEASCLYYKRKLCVYNFTIYDVIRHEGVCYLWSESEAKKGSNEVASCLFDYIEKKVQLGITDFLFWSDNCAGQNRNSNVFAMYVFASAHFKINIKHSFLEVGHTQNEGDSVHARIERYARGRKIYNEDEWCNVIRNAKQTKPPYEVRQIRYNNIYNFKDLSSKMNWKKTTTNKEKTSTTPIGISKIKQVLVSSECLNKLLYKTDFEADYQTQVTRKCKEHVNLNKYKLVKAYSSVQGITAAKKKDLQDLCKSFIIPAQYHEYYDSLPLKTLTNDAADEDDA